MASNSERGPSDWKQVRLSDYAESESTKGLVLSTL